MPAEPEEMKSEEPQPIEPEVNIVVQEISEPNVPDIQEPLVIPANQPHEDDRLEELGEFSELSYDESTLEESSPNEPYFKELNKLAKIGGSRNKF